MTQTTIDGFKLIGLKLPHKTTNEGGQSSKDCGNLWQQFEQVGVADRIPTWAGDAVYAVYYEYEGDHTQPFSYFIGCKAAPEAEAPAGLDSLLIPEGSYTKVTAKGQMPDCIASAWREVWNSGLPRAYRYDFEVYDERSKDWNDAEVELFVGVRS